MAELDEPSFTKPKGMSPPCLLMAHLQGWVLAISVLPARVLLVVLGEEEVLLDNLLLLWMLYGKGEQPVVFLFVLFCWYVFCCFILLHVDLGLVRKEDQIKGRNRGRRIGSIQNLFIAFCNL